MALISAVLQACLAAGPTGRNANAGGSVQIAQINEKLLTLAFLCMFLEDFFVFGGFVCLNFCEEGD